MSTYAIGDIQGCCAEFRELLEHISFDAGRDRLWLVGDMVNRGPHSLEVLRMVRALGSSAVTVLGNHDLHLLAVACGVQRERKGDTLGALIAAPDAGELLDWLRRQPLLHHEQGRVLVHAGLLPDWDLALARSLAGEVEAQLRSPGYCGFLAGLYGNKPDRWAPDLRGMDRWRLTVNAMTRLRFVSEEGVMDFDAKGEVHDAPAGFRPWFELPQRLSADALIVCGHWSALGLRVTPTIAALDTGCVWGGKLTAFRLEDGKVFQVPSRMPAATHAE